MRVANYIESELPEIAQKLVTDFIHLKVWCFYAQMGAGKTTLIKEIAKQLQVSTHTNSPTFSIVNEYESKTVGTVYHFDFYRLENLNEAINIGVEDYLYSGNLCLLEWPECVESIFPTHYLKINIEQVEGNARALTAQPI